MILELLFPPGLYKGGYETACCSGTRRLIIVITKAFQWILFRAISVYIL